MLVVGKYERGLVGRDAIKITSPSGSMSSLIVATAGALPEEVIARATAVVIIDSLSEE